eukprot:gene5086-5587_t
MRPILVKVDMLLAQPPTADQIGYLARVQEWGDNALKSFDCQVDVAVCQAAEHTPQPPPDESAPPPATLFRDIEITATLRSLPLHQGGLGIPRHSGIAGQLGRLQSRKVLQAFVQKHFGADGNLAEALANLPHVEIGANNPSPDDFPDGFGGGQVDLRDRAEAAYSAEADALQARLIAEGRLAHAAWFLSSRFEGSGRWISPPIGLYTTPETTVLGTDYLHALRARLLLHPLEEVLVTRPQLRHQCRSIHAGQELNPGEHDEDDIDDIPQQHPETAPYHHASLLEPFHYLDCKFNKGLTKARHDCSGVPPTQKRKMELRSKRKNSFPRQ